MTPPGADPGKGQTEEKKEVPHPSNLTDISNLLPNDSEAVVNYQIDAVITLFFMAVVAMLVVTSAREWWLVLSRRKPATVHEAPYVETALIATAPAGS